jgi:4-hydroxybenzoate polyprenyltransferase
VALVVAGVRADVGLFYGIGVAMVALLLAFEHRLVHPNDLSRLDAAFFTMNGVISITFFVFVVIDRLVHGHSLPIAL